MKPHHPMACIFPMLATEDLADLAESIQRSGQREPIVLLEGKILDGRNTAAACELIGTAPLYREYNPETDGPSPIRFVLDRNLERRHLTPSQRAAAATQALPFLDGQAAATAADVGSTEGTPAKRPTQAELAEAVNVSPRTIQDAATVQAIEGDEGLKPVIEGKISVANAAKAARAKKKEASPPKPKNEADDTKLAAMRAEAEPKLKKLHGDQFARSVANGSTLTTLADLKEFLALEPDAQRDLIEYLALGWSVKKAIKFHTRSIDTGDTIEELILRANAAKGNKFDCIVAGFKITIQREK